MEKIHFQERTGLRPTDRRLQTIIDQLHIDATVQPLEDLGCGPAWVIIGDHLSNHLGLIIMLMSIWYERENG
jgi:hypothetical protein